MRRWVRLTLIGSLILPSAVTAAPSTLQLANPRGTIGEMGSMGLWEPGFHLTHQNDFLGGTDKLVTQSTSAHLNTLSPNGWSFDLAYSWRLVTPITRTKNGAIDLPEPIGQFIDWEEIGFAASKTQMRPWGGIKLQGSFGYDLMRDNFGKNLLNWIHRVIGSPVFDYGPSLRSWNWSGELEIDYLTPPLKTNKGVEIGLAWGVGWNQDRLMNEGFSRIQITSAWGRKFKLGFEGLYARHLRSSIYGSLVTSDRWEFGASAQLSPYFRTGVRYVSPYLNGDKYGQWYLEVIGLNIPF